MTSNRCMSCGAPFEGYFCHYCNTQGREAEGPEAQIEAIREFNELLRDAKPDDRSILLSTGYLPRSAEALVEAGLQCIPMIRDGASDPVTEAAVRRLETVVSALRMASRSSNNVFALKEFETRLKKFHKEDRFVSIIAWMVIAVGTLFALTLAFWFIRWLFKH
jgi:hypothetical protein